MKILAEYFISAMLITIIILYLSCPNPEIMIKYPDPNDEISDTYIDDNNVCYKYVRKEINV